MDRPKDLPDIELIMKLLQKGGKKKSRTQKKNNTKKKESKTQTKKSKTQKKC